MTPPALLGARRGLLGPGLLSVAVYVVLATAYPDRSDDRFEKFLREAMAWSALALLLASYAWGRRAVVAAPTGVLPWIVALGAAMAVAAVFVRPFNSSDLFAYVNYGWLQSEYGANPYVTVASDVSGYGADPMLSTTWPDSPCPYGFLWTHLARILCALGGGDLQVTILLFKAVNVVTLGAIGWVLWRASPRNDEAGRAGTLFLWLASPFVLIQFIANGHNDLLMALPLVLAFRAASTGRWWAVLPLIAVGVLVKWVAIVASPFALVFLWRRHGSARAAASAGIGLALGVLVALPYLVEGMRVADLLHTWGKASTSFIASLDGVWRFLTGLRPITPGPEGDGFLDVARPAAAAAFLLFWAWRTWRAARRPDYAADDLLADGTLMLLVLLCVAQPAFGPWQIGMFLPAALLLPAGHRLRRVALALSVFSLLSLTFVAKARILDALLMTGLPLLLFSRRRPDARASGSPSHHVAA